MDRKWIAPLAGAAVVAWCGLAAATFAGTSTGGTGSRAGGGTGEAAPVAEPVGTPCGQQPGDPCPLGIERPCGEPDARPGGGTGPQPYCDCKCGPGLWVLEIADRAMQPPVPVTESATGEHVNGTTWNWRRECDAQPWYAESHVWGAGTSSFWHAGSFTTSANARYAITERERWDGEGIPCPRLVQLAAVGGGMMELTLTCSAQAGCSATASTSISGSCSSRGDANASIDGKSIDGSVAYRSMSQSSSIEGKFGAKVSDSSASVEGRISQDAKWEVTGAGAASGSAAYTVRPDRTYCAFTNRPVARSASGFAVCVGGGTVDANGSASFEALAVVAMRVQ
jgi:hypothetical protein